MNFKIRGRMGERKKSIASNTKNSFNRWSVEIAFTAFARACGIYTNDVIINGSSQNESRKKKIKKNRKTLNHVCGTLITGTTPHSALCVIPTQTLHALDDEIA